MGPNSDGKQVVLITGCTTGGIGHSLARAFAATGRCMVVATARSLHSMADLANDNIGGRLIFLLQELDVTSDESVRRVVSNVMEKFGKIDILVNNAGVHCFGPLPEVPLSSMQKVFDTNVFGSLRLIQSVVPHMASRKKGNIVNLGSVVVMGPTPWTGAYVATKAAVHALSDCLRLELKPFGIDVTTLVPGVIKSNMANSTLANYDQTPTWKLYKEYNALIRETLIGATSGLKATTSEEFAKKTVEKLLKKNPPVWFSYGKFSTLAAIMYHLPLFVKDFFIRKAMKI